MKKQSSRQRIQVCPLEQKRREIKNRLFVLEDKLDHNGFSSVDGATEYMLRLEIRRMREFLRELEDPEEDDGRPIPYQAWH